MYSLGRGIHLHQVQDHPARLMFTEVVIYPLRCGITDHRSADCLFKDAAYHFCQESGHLEAVCLYKEGRAQQVKPISTTKDIWRKGSL